MTIFQRKIELIKTDLEKLPIEDKDEKVKILNDFLIENDLQFLLDFVRSSLSARTILFLKLLYKNKIEPLYSETTTQYINEVYEFIIELLQDEQNDSRIKDYCIFFLKNCKYLSQEQFITLVNIGGGLDNFDYIDLEFIDKSDELNITPNIVKVLWFRYLSQKKYYGYLDGIDSDNDSQKSFLSRFIRDMDKLSDNEFESLIKELVQLSKNYEEDISFHYPKKSNINYGLFNFFDLSGESILTITNYIISRTDFSFIQEIYTDILILVSTDNLIKGLSHHIRNNLFITNLGDILSKNERLDISNSTISIFLGKIDKGVEIHWWEITKFIIQILITNDDIKKFIDYCKESSQEYAIANVYFSLENDRLKSMFQNNAYELIRGYELSRAEQIKLNEEANEKRIKQEKENWNTIVNSVSNLDEGIYSPSFIVNCSELSGPDILTINEKELLIREVNKFLGIKGLYKITPDIVKRERISHSSSTVYRPQYVIVMSGVLNILQKNILTVDDIGGEKIYHRYFVKHLPFTYDDDYNKIIKYVTYLDKKDMGYLREVYVENICPELSQDHPYSVLNFLNRKDNVNTINLEKFKGDIFDIVFSITKNSNTQYVFEKALSFLLSNDFHSLWKNNIIQQNKNRELIEKLLLNVELGFSKYNYFDLLNGIENKNDYEEFYKSVIANTYLISDYYNANSIKLRIKQFLDTGFIYQRNIDRSNQGIFHITNSISEIEFDRNFISPLLNVIEIVGFNKLSELGFWELYEKGIKLINNNNGFGDYIQLIFKNRANDVNRAINEGLIAVGGIIIGDTYIRTTDEETPQKNMPGEQISIKQNIRIWCEGKTDVKIFKKAAKHYNEDNGNKFTYVDSFVEYPEKNDISGSNHNKKFQANNLNALNMAMSFIDFIEPSTVQICLFDTDVILKEVDEHFVYGTITKEILQSQGGYNSSKLAGYNNKLGAVFYPMPAFRKQIYSGFGICLELLFKNYIIGNKLLLLKEHSYQWHGNDLYTYNYRKKKYYVAKQSGKHQKLVIDGNDEKMDLFYKNGKKVNPPLMTEYLNKNKFADYCIDEVPKVEWKEFYQIFDWILELVDILNKKGL